MILPGNGGTHPAVAQKQTRRSHKADAAAACQHHRFGPAHQISQLP